MIFNKGVGYFLSLEAAGGGAKGVTTQNKNEVKENIFFLILENQSGISSSADLTVRKRF
jgi:hypothetical protein